MYLNESLQLICLLIDCRRNIFQIFDMFSEYAFIRLDIYEKLPSRQDSDKKRNCIWNSTDFDMKHSAPQNLQHLDMSREIFNNNLTQICSTLVQLPHTVVQSITVVVNYCGTVNVKCKHDTWKVISLYNETFSQWDVKLRYVSKFKKRLRGVRKTGTSLKTHLPSKKCNIKIFSGRTLRYRPYTYR